MPTTTCNIMYRVSDSLMIWEAKSWEVRLSECGLLPHDSALGHFPIILPEA